MARLLSICLVVIILSALLMECESLKRHNKRVRVRRYCCYRKRCVKSSRTRCCGKKMYCIGRGRIGFCRRRPNCRKGRDAEEAEENIDVPDTRELEDNAPIDFLDTLMNP